MTFIPITHHGSSNVQLFLQLVMAKAIVEGVVCDESRMVDAVGNAWKVPPEKIATLEEQFDRNAITQQAHEFIAWQFNDTDKPEWLD